MQRRRSAPRATGQLALAIGCALLVAVPGTATAEPGPGVAGPLPDDSLAATYLVTLDGRPAPHDERAQALLLAAQNDLLRSVGSPRTIYRYTAALDGFAATLDEAQVHALRADPAVVSVERSTRHRVDGFEVAGNQAATRAPTVAGGRAGQGVVVGVVDTGLWPENPSFAALAGARPTIPGFAGGCAGSDHWRPALCNGKIVAARWFVQGFGAANLSASEYLSPRDASGHGTQVSGAAVGNSGVVPTVEHQRFDRISGAAPAARLAVYKACWSAPDPADDGCDTADVVAAVDAAVTDGVDVLNYSVSGTRTGDTLSRAFLGATAAGTLVVASAGNDGPEPDTAGSTSPWVLTVGAATGTAREGVARLGDGTAYAGAMVADHGPVDVPLVLGEDAAAPGVSRDDARLCRAGSLDADRVEGAVVLCDRGATARVSKSLAVRQAGGAGMVLVNDRQRGTDADVHSVPTVHLGHRVGQAVRHYARTATDPRISLAPAPVEVPATPRVAAFSARGGAGAQNLKPDLLATGMGVLSATTPASDAGRLWDFASGTSIAAALMSGSAADVLSLHPTWRPDQVRSALMTTATPAAGTAGAFDQGAGLLDTARASDPGATFDVPVWQYRHLLDGRIEPGRVNLPSVVAATKAPARTVVRRRLTNVGGRYESYRSDIRGVFGYQVTVHPRVLTLPPHSSRQVRIVILRAPTTERGVWSTGHLTWIGRADTGHRLRVPVAVR